MAIAVTLNGVSYSVPEPNEQGYGQALTNYLVALASAFPGAGGSWVTPTGTINGINAVFTLPSTPTGTLFLTLNGVLQVPGVHYSLSTNTITFNAGFIPLTSDLLRACF